MIRDPACSARSSRLRARSTSPRRSHSRPSIRSVRKASMPCGRSSRASSRILASLVQPAEHDQHLGRVAAAPDTLATLQSQSLDHAHALQRHLCGLFEASVVEQDRVQVDHGSGDVVDVVELLLGDPTGRPQLGDALLEPTGVGQVHAEVAPRVALDRAAVRDPLRPPRSPREPAPRTRRIGPPASASATARSAPRPAHGSRAPRAPARRPARTPPARAGCPPTSRGSGRAVRAAIRAGAGRPGPLARSPRGPARWRGRGARPDGRPRPPSGAAGPAAGRGAPRRPGRHRSARAPARSGTATRRRPGRRWPPVPRQPTPTSAWAGSPASAQCRANRPATRAPWPASSGIPVSASAIRRCVRAASPGSSEARTASWRSAWRNDSSPSSARSTWALTADRSTSSRRSPDTSTTASSSRCGRVRPITLAVRRTCWVAGVRVSSRATSRSRTVAGRPASPCWDSASSSSAKNGLPSARS